MNGLLAGAGAFGVLGIILAICVIATFFMIYNDIHAILKLLYRTIGKTEVSSPSAQISKKMCPSCGATYDNTQTICPNCGKA